MQRWKPLLFATVICLASSVQTAHAGGLFSRLFQPSHHAGRARRPAVSYDQRYRYLNAQYPKYVGGFHYSYFRDIGVPPGDVGFRTNGVYATPW